MLSSISDLTPRTSALSTFESLYGMVIFASGPPAECTGIILTRFCRTTLVIVKPKLHVKCQWCINPDAGRYL